ncbi:MAG: YkgJ family cysteine cluster protein [Gemmataceae bacterium]|nr:YkgJ family cysteine cluster protein [Gemmataceae bacterium]
MSDQPRPTFRVELRVLGERVAVEAVRPDGPVRLDEALPFVRQIDDRVIELAVRRTENAGRKVSCRKGCATCCRVQPVPVTPPEAYALLRLVESLPEPRQSAVRQRFADRVERLRAAGLVEPYLRREGAASAERAREVTRKYMALGLECPFLQDDACGIYEDRPFVCRQYLVTTPAELCAKPLDNPVEMVEVPMAAATATLRVTTETLGGEQFTVPLVLALEYAQEHRAELERTHAPEPLFRRFVQALLDPDGEG